MKPFDELTDAEKLALSDGQIEYYIDRACAEAGVALLPPSAPMPPVLQKIEPDITIYNVDGVQLEDMREAEQLRAFLAGLQSRGKKAWNYTGGVSRYTWTKDLDPIAITPESLMSQALYDRNRDAVHAFDEAKTRYEAEREAYRKIVESRDKVASSILDELKRLRREAEDRAFHLAEFERYLLLADGDRRIAWRFLCRVRSRAPELLPDLHAELADEVEYRKVVAKMAEDASDLL